MWPSESKRFTKGGAGPEPAPPRPRTTEFNLKPHLSTAELQSLVILLSSSKPSEVLHHCYWFMEKRLNELVLLLTPDSSLSRVDVIIISLLLTPVPHE